MWGCFKGGRHVSRMHAILDGIETDEKSAVIPKWTWVELMIWWGSRRNGVFPEWWPGE